MSKHLRKMNRESDRDHQLFKEYFLMGNKRNFNDLSLDALVSKRQIYRIAKKYKWRERIAKFTEEQNLKLKAEFARTQKENLNRKIKIMNANYEKIMDVQEQLQCKTNQFLKPELEPERYFKRANQYLNLQLKIQKIEKNFEKQIETFELDEEIELEDLEDELERFGDNDEVIENLKNRYGDDFSCEHELERELEGRHSERSDNAAKNPENENNEFIDPEIQIIKNRISENSVICDMEELELEPELEDRHSERSDNVAKNSESEHELKQQSKLL